jgi:hypothetical protein
MKKEKDKKNKNKKKVVYLGPNKPQREQYPLCPKVVCFEERK